MAVREVEVDDGLCLAIRERDGAYEEKTGRILTGGWIWESELQLARWISRNWKEFIVGKRVIELGAGTGLAGLAAAGLGAREVVLTDRQQLIPWLRENVEANRGRIGDSSVRVAELEWGDDGGEAHRLRPVDAVLCSDLIYDVELVPLLARTLLHLCDEGRATVLLSYEHRISTMECLISLHQQLGGAVKDWAALTLSPAREDGDECRLLVLNF